LWHPLRCAESSLPQFAHRFDNDTRFPRHLNREQNERTDNQNADNEREQEAGAGWPHTFADQPFASGPRRQCDHTGPCERGQETSQEPNRRQD
jgi:hypothetical protein